MGGELTQVGDKAQRWGVQKFEDTMGGKEKEGMVFLRGIDTPNAHYVYTH